MTDIMGDEWDLSEVIAERIQPEDEVSFSFDVAAAYRKSQLLQKLASETDDDKKEEIRAQLEECEEKLKASRYTVKLKGIPRRMREDINSKMLHQFPLEGREALGVPDAERNTLRKNFENNLLWHAQITDVINPSGLSKRNWTVEQIDAFSEQIPSGGVRAIDAKIRELAEKVDQFIMGSQDPNF